MSKRIGRRATMRAIELLHRRRCSTSDVVQVLKAEGFGRFTRHVVQAAVDRWRYLHRTAPHSTSPQLSHNPPNSQKPLTEATQMREISSKRGTPTGSNPAGVAPPSPGNHGDSAPCTELSAVEIHTKGAEKRPLPVVGDIVEVLPEELFRHGQGTTPAWVRARVEGVGAAGFLSDVEGIPYARSFTEEGRCWRWPEAGAVQGAGEGFVRCGYGVPGLPSECRRPEGHDGDHVRRPEHGGPPVGELPEEGEVPLPRGLPVPAICGDLATLDHEGVGYGVRCTLAPEHIGPHWRPASDDLPAHRWGEVPSGAFMKLSDCQCGSNESCAVCEAAVARMCPGLAGMKAKADAGQAPDRLVSEGGAGRVTWRLTCRAGVFTGKVMVGGEVVATFNSAESEAVMNELLALVDRMLEPRDTRAYEPPAVKRLQGEVSGLMGLHGVASGLDRRIGDLTHGLQRVRRSVVDVALDWYERQRREWEVAPALGVLAPGDREIARQLHERQVAELFAKIGGAL